MSKITAAAVFAGIVLSVTVLMAQYTPQPARGASTPPESAPAMVLMGPRGLVPVTKRLETVTLHGTIIEVSCFRKMGAATVASPEQIACAKASLAKGDGVAGILTDGVGTFQLGGSLT